MAKVRISYFFQAVALAALVLGAGLPVAGMADISAPAAIKSSLNALSTTDTEKASERNVEKLGDKVTALEAQIASKQKRLSSMSPGSAGYVRAQREIAQLQATADALDGIASKIDGGFVIDDYRVTTDVSTLGKTITIKLKGKDGSTETVTAEVPSVEDSVTDTAADSSGYGSSTGAGAYGSSSASPYGAAPSTAGQMPTASADPLTQLLQMFTGQQPSAATPNAQSMLNNLVANNGNQTAAPMVNPMTTPQVAAMVCTPDGTQVKPGNGVAVYDITAGKVYMPDGSVLEAHSGLGSMKDNPAYVNQVGQGPTPPGVYNISVRQEGLFHGVEAVRLNPVAGTEMYGRNGILAHSPLRRSSGGGSSGCVAFNDYAPFLAAFKAGQVTQLVVVPSASDASKMCKPSDYKTSTPTS